jgi:hypothetical protein
VWVGFSGVETPGIAVEKAMNKVAGAVARCAASAGEAEACATRQSLQLMRQERRVGVRDRDEDLEPLSFGRTAPPVSLCDRARPRSMSVGAARSCLHHRADV